MRQVVLLNALAAMCFVSTTELSNQGAVCSTKRVSLNRAEPWGHIILLLKRDTGVLEVHKLPLIGNRETPLEVIATFRFNTEIRYWKAGVMSTMAGHFVFSKIDFGAIYEGDFTTLVDLNHGDVMFFAEY